MAVLVFAMLTRNPICIGISFAAGSAYAVYLGGWRKYLKMLRYIAVMFVIIALINPIFNHNGVTILFYMGDDPVTLEASLFGLSSGGMLACIFVWFACYNAIMTNEKFLHLFGKALPTIGLMLTMIMRLVSVTRYKIRRIRNAQTAMGLSARTGTWRQRVAHGVRISSILMSWTMEDSIETAEAMNARGYGSAKRTSFTEYRWQTHDIAAGLVIAALVGVCVYMMIVPFAVFLYYPTVSGELFSAAAVIGYAVYELLLCFPLLLELKETIRWK